MIGMFFAVQPEIFPVAWQISVDRHTIFLLYFIPLHFE